MNNTKAKYMVDGYCAVYSISQIDSSLITCFLWSHMWLILEYDFVSTL